MYTTKAAKITFLLLILVLTLAVMVDRTEAQTKDTTGGDKDLASKKGLAALGGTKKADASKKPSKLQMSLGVASIFVMIAVVKWA
jgi:hypothetical protein